MKRITKLVAIPIITLGGLLLSACYSGNLSGPTVGISGDSITYLSSAAISTQLDPNYAIDIQAVPGATIGDELSNIATMDTGDRPTHWIIELGTNDAVAADEGNPTPWATNLATLFSEVSYAQCIVLTTVNTNADTYGGGSSTVAVQINAALRAEAATHPNFIVLDWNYLVQANPGWLQSDGIHPNATGQSELAAWDGFALHLCP